MLQGFDFSHEGVKRVVGLFTGFVSVIASAPYRFLYLKQRIHDYKKRKKKRKNKKEGDRLLGPRTISPPPPAIEISTRREIIVTFAHPPLFCHDGYCLGVDIKPSPQLSGGLTAPPLCGSSSRP